MGSTDPTAGAAAAEQIAKAKALALITKQENWAKRNALPLVIGFCLGAICTGVVFRIAHVFHL